MSQGQIADTILSVSENPNIACIKIGSLTESIPDMSTYLQHMDSCEEQCNVIITIFEAGNAIGFISEEFECSGKVWKLKSITGIDANNRYAYCTKNWDNSWNFKIPNKVKGQSWGQVCQGMPTVTMCVFCYSEDNNYFTAPESDQRASSRSEAIRPELQENQQTNIPTGLPNIK